MKKRSQQDEETASTVIGNEDEKMLDRLPDPVILVPAPSEQRHVYTNVKGKNAAAADALIFPCGYV